MSSETNGGKGMLVLMLAWLDLLEIEDQPAVRESIAALRETLKRVDAFSSYRVLELKMKNLMKVRDTALLTARCGELAKRDDRFPIREYLERALEQLERASHSTGTFSSELDEALESVRTARALADIRRAATHIESSGETMLTAANDFQANLSDIAHVILDQQRQIDELSGELEEQRRHAMIDELTGIYNRRAFEKQLDAAIAQARRFRTPLCLFMIDMDHFKDINDAHGHQVGDDVLVNFARLLSNSMREYDMVFRYGGDEFAVLFPNEGLAKGKHFSERIKGFVESKPYRFENLRFKLGISGGLTELRDDDTRESFFERADKLLYEAKRTGRGKISIA